MSKKNFSYVNGIFLSSLFLLSTPSQAFKTCIEFPILNTGLAAVLTPKLKDCGVKGEFPFLKNTTGAGSWKFKAEATLGDATTLNAKMKRSLLPFLLKECVYTDCSGYTYSDVVGSRLARTITLLLNHEKLKVLVNRLYQEKIEASKLKNLELKKQQVFNIIVLRTEIRRILEEELSK